MISFQLYIFVFFISLLVSLLLTPLMRFIALKKGILSRPSLRNIHAEAVPLLGGLAIYFSFVIAMLFIFFIAPQAKAELSGELTGLLLASTLIVMLGLWDDIKTLRPLTKLLAQIAIALVLFNYGFRINLLTNPFFGGQIQIPLFLSILITTIWFLGLINAMNLIDGLDGLAAGITVIVCGVLILVALFLGNYINAFILLAFGGSVLGFLRFNFYPAQIFMGDAGSMFLGLVLASAALMGVQYKSATATTLLTPIIALAIPIYDTLIAIIRRPLKKYSIFKADKKHLHHRLMEVGLGQPQIVLFLYLVTAYLGIFAFLFVLIPKEYAFILLVLLAIGLFTGTKIIIPLLRRRQG